MTTLYILRHARAEAAAASGQDRDRPLSSQGRLQCEALAEKLARGQPEPPATVLASPAVRAMQTAEAVLAGIQGPEIEQDERIWEAGVADLVAVISEATDRPGPVMVVGHNPGLEALVRTLTGELQPMGTAALAVLELQGPPGPGTAELVGVI